MVLVARLDLEEELLGEGGEDAPPEQLCSSGRGTRWGFQYKPVEEWKIHHHCNMCTWKALPSEFTVAGLAWLLWLSMATCPSIKAQCLCHLQSHVKTNFPLLYVHFPGSIFVGLFMFQLLNQPKQNIIRGWMYKDGIWYLVQEIPAHLA